MGTADLEERALHQGLIKVAAAYVHAVRRQSRRHHPATSRAPAGHLAHAGGAAAAWGVDVEPSSPTWMPGSPTRPPPRPCPTRHPEDARPVNPPDPIPAVDPLYADLRRRDPVRPALVLDVREPHEFSEVRVEGSLLVPMSQLNTRLDEIPRDRPLLVMCQVGGRSARVTGFLRQQGYEDVGNVAGGIDAWQRMGLPVRQGPPAPGEGELPS